jgi:hypothetical protein
MVDFPGFTVAPGSRRGVVNDPAAEAFARALATLEPALAATLAEIDRRRAEELDRTLIRDLQRAFRDLLRSRPRYELPPVADRPAERAPGGEPQPTRAADADQDAVAGLPPPEPGEPRTEILYHDDSLPLFPPGPLDHAAIAPASLRLPCGGRRTATARALDRDGRPIADAFRCRWQLEPPGTGRLEPASADTPEVAVVGADAPVEGRLHLRVEVEGRRCDAEAAVTVVDQVGPSRSGEGIPAPTLLEDPGAPWRSRWHDDRWEVNAAHRDFRAVADKPAHKLRYLAALFAKEIVLRSSNDPRLEKPLEQLVEVFSYADLRLVRGGRKKGKGE